MRHIFQRIKSGRGRAAATAAAVAASATMSLLAAAPTAAFAQGGGAAAPSAAGPKFGSVDLGRVANEAKGRQASQAEMVKMQGELESVLRRIAQGSSAFLTEAEVNELAGLYEKAAPTDAEKKRIGVLEQKGDQASQQLTALQNTANPDEAQQTRFKQLSDQREIGQQSLQKLEAKYQQRLRDRERELLTKLDGEVRAAVAKVAQQKGLAVVYNGQFAVYTQNDITEDVLKAINGGK